jgi:hypothetical protein
MFVQGDEAVEVAQQSPSSPWHDSAFGKGTDSDDEWVKADKPSPKGKA